MSIFNVINSEAVDPIVEINGIVNLDVIKINGIDNLWPNFTGDDFTGVDGDPPNTRVWTESDANNYLDIQSNKLNYDTGGAAGSQDITTVDSKFVFTGDFDITIDLLISTWTGLSGSYTYPLLFYIVDGVTEVGFIGKGIRSTTQKVHAGGGTDQVFVAYADTSLQNNYRIKRTSGVVVVYVFENSRWEWNGSTSGLQVIDSNTNDLFVRLKLVTRAGDTLAVNIDDFVIQSGVFTPPNFWGLFRGDDFTGSNDDPPDPRAWKFVTGYTGDAYTTIQGNVLDFDPPNDNGNYIARMQGRFKLTGDFDIQIDFHHNTFSLPTSGSDASYLPNLIIRTVSGDTAIAYIQRRRFISVDGNDDYNAYGTDQAQIDAEDSESTGKLRITRISGNVKVYYWSSSQWEFDGDTAGLSVVTNNVNDVYVEVWLEQATNSITDGYVDNFVINSGTVSVR